IVANNTRLFLIRGNAHHNAGFTRHQFVHAQASDIAGEHRNGPRLATTSTDDAKKFLNHFVGRQLPLGQPAKRPNFIGLELLAHRGKQDGAPRVPRGAVERGAEQPLVLKGDAETSLRLHGSFPSGMLPTSGRLSAPSWSPTSSACER